MLRRPALLLLLSLLCPAALAEPLYLVELILFRQAGEVIPSSQLPPDDWAAGGQSITPSPASLPMQETLNKLAQQGDYQVILQRSWKQTLSSQPLRVKLHEGKAQLGGHYPVQGTLTLRQSDDQVQAQAHFWVSQFASNGLLQNSQQLQQQARLRVGRLHYLDHTSLGLLVRISAL